MNWIRIAAIVTGVQAGVAGAQCETTYLEAPDPTALSYFGQSMDEGGGLLMIGAPGSRYAGSPSGRVFEFQRESGIWSYRDVIDAPGVNTRFGHSVAIDGNRLVVGAPDHGPPGRIGAAHIYRRDASGWRLEATLLAPDGVAEDRFGWSVDIAGGTVAVGVPFRREVEDESGAVYFFRLDGSAWEFDGKVIHDTVQWRNYFGYQLGLVDDGSCVVAAFGAEESSGALMWFVRESGDWQLRQKIIGSEAHGLGRALDVQGDVVAATGSSATLETTAVFLYQFDGTWRPLHTMTAEGSWRLGRQIALDNGRVLVGAPNNSLLSRRSGQAHLFHFDASGWTHEAFMMADPWRRFENFGESVLFAAGDPLVGAHSDHHVGVGSGAVAALIQPVSCFCPGDFNRDGVSDFFDWLDYLTAYVAGDPRADIDLDGEIDPFDYLSFQLEFEVGCWG